MFPNLSLMVALQRTWQHLKGEETFVGDNKSYLDSLGWSLSPSPPDQDRSQCTVLGRTCAQSTLDG